MSKNKIILFHPDAEDKTYWLPYSILAIGSALSSAGYEVILLDENIKKDKENLRTDIESILRQNIDECLFIGISSFIGNQIRNGLNFAALVRNLNKDIPIVWGGWHPSILTNITIEDPMVDFIIIGQGEKTILDLADEFLKVKQDFSHINGLVYKSEGKVIQNRERKSVNRSELPRYDFSLINIDDYIVNDPAISDKSISYISSQGCPFSCGFCSDRVMYKRKWFPLTATQMFDDIKALVENHNIKGISFYDSNFTVDKNRIMEFCRLVVESKINFKWAAASDLFFLQNLSEEEWSLLRDSGCVRLLVGAESGSKRILKLIGKNFEPEDVMAIASKSVEYDISIYFTMITGWPPNPKEEFEETRNLIEDIRKITMEHEFIIHIYAPFEGTPLYSYACEYGYEPPVTLKDWSNYDYYKIKTPWVTNEFIEEVQKYRMELNISYNIHKMRKNLNSSK
ncbi:B12-binding domain-containing radical SAM protein [Clostridium tertium]|uniref:B12-binding domain-containing radical SAM protein n=1 Tax=Clostridium tertium TaxID=1559 RepID=UPI0024B32BC2|nr:radical SAM protein [Clostridium tertium]MDI9216412.1 B12-binding domain-containing radical SAM protein [Clostridium tertium]